MCKMLFRGLYMLLFVCCFVLLFIVYEANGRGFKPNKDTNPSFVQVTSFLTSPYVILKNNSANANEESIEYEGYLIDLLKRLAEDVGFKYNISLVKDQHYGRRKEEGEWNGMIGEVLRGDADLAVADLTITSTRQKVVHFSFPYMTAGIGLLMKRPPYYLNPEVIINNRHFDPADNATPIVIYPVSSIEDLPKQNIVQYGCIDGGATMQFFKESRNELYQQIAGKLIHTRTVDEGVKRVMDSNGTFIFFMEGPAIDYITGRECGVVQLGKPLNLRSYGLAMRKNYKLKGVINSALIALQEQGFLAEIRRKWFPEPRQCDQKIDKPYARNALSLVLEGIN